MGKMALTLLFAFTFCAGCAQRTYLFNGQDLTGWEHVIKDQQFDAADIWSIDNGIIQCKGTSSAYIRTTKDYSDYKLHLEWRWPQEPSNSGVLLHASTINKEPVSFWPRCIQAPLKPQHAGDLVLVNHTSFVVEGRTYKDDKKTIVVVPGKHENNEKAVGKWNSFDIYCEGDVIMICVNGKLQNVANKSSETSGWIGLQSAKTPIEFRNIYIEKE